MTESKRLDVFLSAKFGLSSRSNMQKLIKMGKVKINGKIITKNSHLVLDNDDFVVDIPEVENNHLLAENIAINIVYEDQDIVVINKNRGILVHPGFGNKYGTLINALIYYYKDQIINVGNKDRPGIVHRLDRDTSGLLVVAKNDFSFYHLVNQFSNRSIKRKYIALVWGKTPLEGRWEKNIDRSRSDYKKMVVSYRSGKYALTDFITLNNFGNLISLISCKLHTGRTHQIRVHANHAGYPLIGDPIYCKSKDKLCQKMPENLRTLLKTINFQCLHAQYLEFIHPRTENIVHFSSKIPDDMVNIINCLEEYIYDL